MDRWKGRNKEREGERDGLKVKNDNDFSANHRTFLLI